MPLAASRRALACVVLPDPSIVGSSARAQSGPELARRATDEATARTSATEGIQPVRRRLLHPTPSASWHLGSVQYAASERPSDLNDSRVVDDSPAFSVVNWRVGGEFFFGGND